MWKALLICVTLTSPIFAGDVNLPNNLFNKDLQPLIDLSIREYKYSDFGFSKDLLTAIVGKSDKAPIAYFYLGRIYDRVDRFRDNALASKYYLLAATNTDLPTVLRQKSYLALTRLTKNPQSAMMFAEDSQRLGNSDQSKKAFVMAYQKQTQHFDYSHTQIVNLLR